MVKRCVDHFFQILDTFTYFYYQVLSIKNADFSWSKTAAQPTLEAINLSVRKGELLGVFGKVGCGKVSSLAWSRETDLDMLSLKTSLLCAIIGDMTRREGEVTVKGSIAYAPQNPWILSATVRENILFSHEYDETFYNMVVEGMLTLNF